MKPPIKIEDLRNSACAKLNPHLFEPEQPKAKKKNKFNAQAVDIEGKKFDSRKEAKRYTDLRRLLKAGVIGQLAHHVEFELNVGGTHSLIYEADFTYIIAKTGEKVVEDVKSEPTRQTAIYKKKKKLMKRLHGIQILET
jgi:hypothetical protein